MSGYKWKVQYFVNTEIDFISNFDGTTSASGAAAV